MNRTERNEEREAVLAAYELRIATGEYDLRAGRNAEKFFFLVHGVFLALLMHIPVGLAWLLEIGLGPLPALKSVAGGAICVGWLFYIGRVFIPVAFDVVWEMDLLSKRKGYIRVDDVFRLCLVWIVPRQLGQWLGQIWKRYA